jgi:hypothetical protein
MQINIVRLNNLFKDYCAAEIKGGEWNHRARIALRNQLEGDCGNIIAEICELRSRLDAIHDYAHAHSTGPAVPDHLWEVRRMASEA